MKALFALLFLAVSLTAQAQPRFYQQAELEALLAPIALYPDPVLSQVLIASTFPQDVREAAAWSRANAHLKADEAMRAAEPMPWDPSVKSLLAYPDLLARMDESPQWTADLGAAFMNQEPQVMATVQALRHRAQASGFLNSDGYQAVQQYGSYIAVQPLYPHIAYVPWYNPVVVFGPWWHTHRPIAWRPWPPRPAAFVSFNFHKHHVVDWHRKHVVRAPRVVRPPVTVHNHVHQATRARPIVQGARIEAPFRAGEPHRRSWADERSHAPREDRAAPRDHRGESRWSEQRGASPWGQAQGRGGGRGRN